jgi:ABC-type transport system substrate-binding protein
MVLRYARAGVIKIIGCPEEPVRTSRRSFLALSAAALAAGCGKKSFSSRPAGSVLRYPLTMDPNALDPHLTDSIVTGELLQNVYDGLTYVDANNRIAPLLAERWEISPDGQTYTFHLNQKARFHNGRPCLAADVKYSLERVLWPETRSPGGPDALKAVVGAPDVIRGKTKDVAGIKVLNDHTLQVTTDGPRAYMLMELGVSVVCREAVEASGGHMEAKTAIGTGPFRLAEYQPGRKVVLEANKDYHLGKPQLDRIDRPIVLDRQTAVHMYEAGEIDLDGVSPNDFARFQASPETKSQTRLVQMSTLIYVVLHMRAQPAFADVRVREAFARAIDRDEVVRIAEHGISIRAGGLLAPGILGYSPGLRPMPYDPASARSLLAAAGYSPAHPFPKLSLAYIQKSPTWSAIAQIVRDNLQRNLGVDVDLQEREEGSLLADAHRDSVDNLSNLIRSNASENHTGFADPQIDALCVKADAEMNPQKRAALYAQANQLAVDRVAVVPLVFNRAAYLVKPYVHGLEFNLGGLLPHYRTSVAT